MIAHREKTKYDFIVPATVASGVWLMYFFVFPKMAFFGDAGLLKFTRDLLIMAVPFMVGALASVAMGSPGKHLDRRPVGAELILDGSVLTLRQFVCHMLGYLSFLGLVTLALAVSAELTRSTIIGWLVVTPEVVPYLKGALAFFYFLLLSALGVTVLWALYFLTDIVNRPGDNSDDGFVSDDGLPHGLPLSSGSRPAPASRH